MDDLEFGLRTTALGMGLVFGMLTGLWGLLTLAVRVDRRMTERRRVARAGARAVDGAAPANEGRAGTVPSDRVGQAGTARLAVTDAAALDPLLVAAITVAVVRHAETSRLQAAPSMRAYWPGSLLFASRWVAAGRTRQGQSWARRR
jgi:hypothetical protein